MKTKSEKPLGLNAARKLFKKGAYFTVLKETTTLTYGTDRKQAIVKSKTIWKMLKNDELKCVAGHWVHAEPGEVTRIRLYEQKKRAEKEARERMEAKHGAVSTTVMEICTLMEVPFQPKYVNALLPLIEHLTEPDENY